MKIKAPRESKAILTEIVMPNDTNNLNNLMGGRLLHWMDMKNIYQMAGMKTLSPKV